MDVIYGISIFTHLSEQMHYKWLDELYRILKPGGILFLTTHGDNFKVKLTPKELQHYNHGSLVVRGGTFEGHRTFSAYQPNAFMHALFQKMQILEHQCPPPIQGKWLPQDVWVVRK